VSKTEEVATLIRFRQELYDSLGLRQDSLFELVDAALTAPLLNVKQNFLCMSIRAAA
jgi:lipoprotein NlpI